MKSPEAGAEPNKIESPAAADVTQTSKPQDINTAPSNDGQFRELKMATPSARSYVAISPPFLPNYSIAMTSVPPIQQVPSPASRTKTMKATRPPCHHARYVLEEKPKRLPTASDNMECTNCGTKNTSAWRRSAEGKSECNACNLFFRKNGRKRPASMRRDTIARRYRLSRCDLCAMEAQGGGQPNLTQVQKGRNRKNGKAKITVRQADDPPGAGQLCATSGPHGTAPQQYFITHTGFQQPMQTFLPTNVSYVHQNPVMMSYATERTVFNVMNVEQQLASTPPDPQFCFARNARTVIAAPPSRVMTADVVEQEGREEKFGVIDENTETVQQEVQKQYREFEPQPQQQYADYPPMVKSEPIEEHYRSEFSEAFTVVKREDLDGEYVGAPTATSLLGEGSVKSESRQALDVPLELLKEKPQELDDGELVFRSL
ncbi:hypothetical protein Y032_0347g3157 [Ancylostoma ceylanicum]|uniref:GATA-type domain-containing protein n=1 Tax=Ancylostoma ceylanicum TaxID=53326 RepID=A0A016RXU8_9BILA|nr:hypothetical protein Y032_0347g3157 [Ancylostoma ceylanicum]